MRWGISRRDFLAAMAAGATIALAPEGFVPLAFSDTDEPKSLSAFSAGWQMQSSELAKLDGAALSKAGADTHGWYNIDLPSTVLAGLVANGEYPDLLNSDNLKRVPKERFAPSWWYRKEFDSSTTADDAQAWLYFKGINYRANVWLNGKKVGDAKDMAGAYRDIELNVTDALVHGTNALAVEVFAPQKEDLTITFVDWAPAPPDANMGIWQDVELRFSKPVAIRYPHVSVNLDLPQPNRALLLIYAELVNPTDHPIEGMIESVIDGNNITVPAALGPRQRATIACGELIIDNPRLWWPWQLGKPEMYELKQRYLINGIESDRCSIQFGIRKVTSRMEKGARLFSINGVDLLILGGGYAPDLLQRRAPKYRPGLQEDHIRYVRDMNLNTVRLEGKLEDDAFYDLCDKHGVLVMPGWCCCSPWEQWNKWKDEQHSIAMESMRYQIRRARTHPSILCFLNGSDNHPTPQIEKEYLEIEKQLMFPCPTVSSATAKKSEVTGASGVKMEGPYKWEPPIYWLTDKTKGGAHGFNTEVGPGAVPPPLESLEKMLPPEHRWPIDGMWGFHSGKGNFSNINDFTDALDARFGDSKSLADFAWKAQAQAYETIRAMYEGFRRNKFNTATGEIQWMLNNAWPSMIWHLYDYYFRPGAAYFATKLACEPLHILYAYDNAGISVVNDSLQGYKSLTASARVFDLNGKMVAEYHQECASGPNSSSEVMRLPDLSANGPTYFVRLSLENAGRIVSINSYFLSSKPDVIDEHAKNKDDWAFSPCSSYADYTSLENLPKVDLRLKDVGVTQEGNESSATVTVSNASSAIALLVRLKLTRGKDGEEILPIRWQDNFFMLLPNESRQIYAQYLMADAEGKLPEISVDCFNNGRIM